MIEKKVDQVLEVIDLVALFCRQKSDASVFFMEKVLPLIPHINNSQILLGFKAIFDSLLVNPSAASIFGSLRLLASGLEVGKKIEQLLDYDILFNQVANITETVDTFDNENLRVVLTFVFKLLGSSDLSVRIKSLDVFQILFNSMASLNDEERQTRFDLVLSVFSGLTTVLRLTYSTEDSIKYYIEAAILLSKFYTTHKVKLACHQKTQDLITDILNMNQSEFLDSFLNPKIISKTLALREFLNSPDPSISTIEDFMIPMLENILFFNFAKHASDLKENNFRMASSKKAHLTHLIIAASKVLKKLTAKLPFSKLTSYIYRKLNMLQTQTEFQQQILMILNEVFENYAAINADFDAVVTIHRFYEKRNDDLEILFGEIASFEKQTELNSFRKNYKKLSNGKMKAVRDNIHSQIDFGVQTNEFLLPQNDTKHTEVSLKTHRNKLKNMILLKLKKMMFSDKRDDENLELRFALSECFLKVLRLFPVDLFKIEYAKMIMELAQVLRKKDPAVREKTMKCLYKISRITGPYLLSICFSEIGFALSLSSYRHVRNYSIWYILNMISLKSQIFDPSLINETNFEPGCLDHLFCKLGEFICEETFSDMYEEKNGEDRKRKTKEIKKNKSKEILRLLIQQVTSKQAVR